MAHVSNTTTAPGAVDRLREVFESLLSAAARYLAYRRSLRELSRLDERMLEDIGLKRTDLRSVARDPINWAR